LKLAGVKAAMTGQYRANRLTQFPWQSKSVLSISMKLRRIGLVLMC